MKQKILILGQPQKGDKQASLTFFLSSESFFHSNPSSLFLSFSLSMSFFLSLCLSLSLSLSILTILFVTNCPLIIFPLSPSLSHHQFSDSDRDSSGWRIGFHRSCSNWNVWQNGSGSNAIRTGSLKRIQNERIRKRTFDCHYFLPSKRRACERGEKWRKRRREMKRKKKRNEGERRREMRRGEKDDESTLGFQFACPGMDNWTSNDTRSMMGRGRKLEKITMILLFLSLFLSFFLTPSFSRSLTLRRRALRFPFHSNFSFVTMPVFSTFLSHSFGLFRYFLRYETTEDNIVRNIER